MEQAPAVVTVDVADLGAWFRRFAALVEERAEELSALDAAIGDADHGTNMRRGCRAVLATLDESAPTDVNGFGKAVGMRLISAVGGASGPLYGSFFLAFGGAGGSADFLDPGELAACWEAGVASVETRGKASRGDKTMLDALLPAVEVMNEAAGAGRSLGDGLAAGTSAAEEGMRATTPMLARKGRASYLGERSVGHQDPGATSSWLLLRAAAESLPSAGPPDEG
jgi:phosphoenolpyruvate---glycerone phosphotransferase subunit DhaL